VRTAPRHREPASLSTTRYEANGLVIDLAKRLVTRDGEPLHLTPKEYDLLAHMARHAGLVVTHRQLLAAVWGPAHVEDMQYLRVFVGQLRSKVERNPANPRLICTEPGVGYRFAQ
jgi:two-component system KDP operon response regulator KdpE